MQMLEDMSDSRTKRARRTTTEIHPDEADMSIAIARAKRNFSWRLYDALQNGKRTHDRFLFWGDDGDTFFVEEQQFEDKVLFAYPGLVAISSFKNFLRQLRVYDFESLGVTCNGLHRFYHPNFKKDREDLVLTVQPSLPKTKGMGRGRKQPRQRYSYSSPSCNSSPSCSQRSDMFPADMAMGDAPSAEAMPTYSPFGLPLPPSSLKPTNDAACQTSISMEMFSRLEPWDISVSAMMLPSLVSFIERHTQEDGMDHFSPPHSQFFKVVSPPMAHAHHHPHHPHQQAAAYSAFSPPISTPVPQECQTVTVTAQPLGAPYIHYPQMMSYGNVVHPTPTSLTYPNHATVLRPTPTPEPISYATGSAEDHQPRPTSEPIPNANTDGDVQPIPATSETQLVQQQEMYQPTSVPVTPQEEDEEEEEEEQNEQNEPEEKTLFKL